MLLPSKLEFREPISPRLWVSSSVVKDPKRTLALLILLWLAKEKPAKMTITPANELVDGESSLKLLLSYANSLNVPVKETDLGLNTVSLFQAQIESLDAVLCLVWRLARVSTVGSPRSAERIKKDGELVRGDRVIRLTSNIDLIGILISTSPIEYITVLFAWLQSKKELDHVVENRLIRMLGIFSDQVVCKTDNDVNGYLYSLPCVYDALLSANELETKKVLTCTNSDPKGPVRAVKNLIIDGLNPWLSPISTNNAKNVILAKGVNKAELNDYMSRAFTSFNTARVDYSDLSSNAGTKTAETSEASEVKLPYNLIYFGAPGTGKSHSLNKLAGEHFDKAHTRRVTFHPDYSYASFVGCYKPTMQWPEQKPDESLSENMRRPYISYEFVPGPLVKSYVEAKTHPNEDYLLIVEELNRANPAAVFGDVFQLLDRKGDGASEYDVDVPVDLGEFLWKEFYDASGCADEAPGLYSHEENVAHRVNAMRLPSNLYIWTTMNSADQGVFPMDTAFKRRWEFRYMGIDEGEGKYAGKVVRIGAKREPVEWNVLRHAINGLLKGKARVNEDKLLGPFFLKESALDDDEAFDEAFKSKVLLYLYEDAAKMKRPKVFRHPDFTYSEICAEYDSSADGVFALDEPVPRVEDGAPSEDEGNGQGAEE